MSLLGDKWAWASDPTDFARGAHHVAQSHGEALYAAAQAGRSWAWVGPVERTAAFDRGIVTVIDVWAPQFTRLGVSEPD